MPWRFRYRRPPHAFVLTRDRVVHVSVAPRARSAREALGTVQVHARDLPPGALSAGANGEPIAGKAVADAVGALLAGPRAKVGAASLAVPDDFLRIASVDVDGDARGAREAEEIVRWKVGRLFGEPVPALRLSWQPVGDVPAGGGTRYLVLAAVESAVASWEAAFAARGIRIGALEPASLAVTSIARDALPAGGFLVWADGTSVSTAFLSGRDLRFLRTTETGGDPEQALQEIRLAASFVGGDAEDAASRLDLHGPAVVAPWNAPAVELFRAFRRDGGGPEPLSLWSTLESRGLGPRQEDPAVAVGVGLLAGEE